MSDRLAVVTGTTSGIGEAVARLLLESRLARRRARAARGAAAPRPLRPRRGRPRATWLDSLARDVEGPRLSSNCFGEVGAGRRVGLVNNAAHRRAARSDRRTWTSRQLPRRAGDESRRADLADGASWSCARRRPATPLRIVNVSSGSRGAGIRGPRRLRLAGRRGCAWRAWCSPPRSMTTRAVSGAAAGRRGSLVRARRGGHADASCSARSSARETLPSVDMFVGLAADGRLVAPAGRQAKSPRSWKAETSRASPKGGTARRLEAPTPRLPHSETDTLRDCRTPRLPNSETAKRRQTPVFRV